MDGRLSAEGGARTDAPFEPPTGLRRALRNETPLATENGRVSRMLPVACAPGAVLYVEDGVPGGRPEPCPARVELLGSGHEVVVARSPEEALHAVRASPRLAAFLVGRPPRRSADATWDALMSAFRGLYPRPTPLYVQVGDDGDAALCRWLVRAHGAAVIARSTDVCLAPMLAEVAVSAERVLAAKRRVAQLAAQLNERLTRAERGVLFAYLDGAALEEIGDALDVSTEYARELRRRCADKLAAGSVDALERELGWPCTTTARSL